LVPKRPRHTATGVSPWSTCHIFLTSREMATATIPDVHPQTSTAIRIQFRVDQGNRGTLPETIFADDVLPDFECISGPIPFAYN